MTPHPDSGMEANPGQTRTPPFSPPLALALRNVTRRMIPGGPPVLNGITLSIRAGELVSLAGPSGSGKSTLLRLLNRLDEANGGTVEVLGQPVANWPVRTLRSHAAFVFQEPILLRGTVREELLLPFELRDESAFPLASEHAVGESLALALETAGLPRKFLDRSCKALSAGERQRVALARALVTRPGLLLLDEPTSGLDEETSYQLLDNLREINRSLGTTMIVANHRLGEVRHLGGRLLVLLEGTLAADGPVPDLVAHSPGGRISAFLNGNRDRAAAAGRDTAHNPHRQGGPP